MAQASVGGWARWRIWLIAAGAGLISLLLIDAFRALLGEVHYDEVMQQMFALFGKYGMEVLEAPPG